MSKVCASSHKYPHIEKSRIFGNRISKVRWPTTVTEKELTSQQKEKPHGKENNLTTKRITTTSRQKKCPLGIEEILPWGFFLLWVFFFLPWGFSFYCESFLFAARWGYSFCRESFSFCHEVFLFAVRLMLLPWQLWATVLRWGKQQAVANMIT